MRNIFIGAASVAATALAFGAVTMTAATAQAEVPGSCLVVQNHTGYTTAITLNYPTVAGRWTFSPDEVSVITNNNRVIKSPSGVWNIQKDSDVQAVWVYDGDRNTSKGCAGSWVVSLN